MSCGKGRLIHSGQRIWGSTSGVFVFTDRGSDRIERAILERRWGDSFAFETWRVDWDTRTVEEAGGVRHHRRRGTREAAVRRADDGVRLPVQGPSRVRGGTRSKTIAVNYKLELGPYPTTTRAQDGLSHTDYLLLARELGAKYVSPDRVVRARDDGLHHPAGAD